MPPKEQIFIGAATAVLSVIGLANCGWILENTRKGKRLADWLGPDRAVWVLRGLLVCAALFGGLLAANVIKPIQW